MAVFLKVNKSLFFFFFPHPSPHLSLIVSRSSATGSSGDEIGKALASVSGHSLVSDPQAVFKTDDLLAEMLLLMLAPYPYLHIIFVVA